VSLPAVNNAGRGGAPAPLGLVALVVLLAGTSCGQAELADARRDASGALEQVQELEGRVAELESALRASDAQLDGLVSSKAEFDEELKRLGRRMGRGIERLRAAVKDARQQVSSAGENAVAAVARAAELARDLAVLENRYDYHLRHYHGGGG
jgi:hypothetical protein